MRDLLPPVSGERLIVCRSQHVAAERGANAKRCWRPPRLSWRRSRRWSTLTADDSSLAPLGRWKLHIAVKSSGVGLDGARGVGEDAGGPMNRVPPGRTTQCGAQGLCRGRLAPHMLQRLPGTLGQGVGVKTPIVGSRAHARRRAVSDCRFERVRRFELPARAGQSL